MKLFKIICTLIFASYVLLVLAFSVHRHALVFDPRVIKFEIEMLWIESQSGESIAEDQSRSNAKLNTGDVLSQHLEHNKVEYRELSTQDFSAHLEETEMLIVDMDSRFKAIESLKPPALNKTAINEIDLQGTRIGLTSEAIPDEDLAQLEFLAADPQDLPSEADINAIISKNSSSNTSSSSIPTRVLNRVEETTGISQDEVQELLNREPNN